MMHICQCHWVKKCCFKCHPDFHRNLSYTTFTFGFIIKKLQELCFWGLFYSIVGLSHYCKNQFLCIEYLPSLQTPLDQLTNYKEKTAFSEQSKFPHFRLFLGAWKPIKLLQGILITSPWSIKTIAGTICAFFSIPKGPCEGTNRP